MASPPSDETLQRAYARMLAARGGRAGLPDIPVETIAALASGTYPGTDRVEQLDRALAHPVTAGELRFFSALAADAPQQAPVRVATRHREWLVPLAAAVVISAGIGLLWRGSSRLPPEVMRGDREFAIVEPVSGGGLGARLLFVWRAAPDATRYRLELVDQDGEQVLSVETGDTSAVLPAQLGAGSYQARVTATRRDGTEVRTPATPFTVP
jgi:hypothetical protein